MLYCKRIKNPVHCSPKHSVSVFFVFYPALYIDQALLPNCFSLISIYLLLPLKWTVLVTCTPSPAISLFSVICFELPITQPPYNYNFFFIFPEGLSYWELTVCKK